MTAHTYTGVICLLMLASFGEARAQAIDSPLPLQVGVTTKVTLDENERCYFKTPLAAGAFKVILDTRRADEVSGNLISSLSLLDGDGAVVQERAIGFNEIDVDFRGVYTFSLKTPTTAGFKLSNDNAKAVFWLTVVSSASHTEVPFFGRVLPKSLVEGESKAGVLGQGESAYYVIDLKKGDYKAVLDFQNSEGQNTNIQGYLALLDADGARLETVIGLNEVDVEYRKLAAFSVKKDTTLILRVENTIYRVNYAVRVVPA
ncbi:MAG TPA: hypothetical protein VJX67_20660 [Blastocatellia bacterium]|nr:hypothetical protein [Blastocatellia bacterium]